MKHVLLDHCFLGMPWRLSFCAISRYCDNPEEINDPSSFALTYLYKPTDVWTEAVSEMGTRSARGVQTDQLEYLIPVVPVVHSGP